MGYWQETHEHARFRPPEVSFTFKKLFPSISQDNQALFLEVGAGNGRHIAYTRRRLAGKGDFIATDISLVDLKGIENMEY